MRGSVLKMCRGPDLLGQHQVERGSTKPRQQAKARSRNLESDGLGPAGTSAVQVNRSTAAGRSGAPVAYHHPQALLACDKFGGSARRQIGGLQTCISRQSLQSSKPPASSSRVPSHTNCASDRCAQRGAERGTHDRRTPACPSTYWLLGGPHASQSLTHWSGLAGRESPNHQPRAKSIPRARKPA